MRTIGLDSPSRGELAAQDKKTVPQTERCGSMSMTQTEKSGAELTLRVELGQQWLPADEVHRLAAGSVVELGSTADSPVDVYAGSQLAARGELVVVEGRLGIRIASVAGRK
jgi:flagellar motor switch protein FliN